MKKIFISSIFTYCFAVILLVIFLPELFHSSIEYVNTIDSTIHSHGLPIFFLLFPFLLIPFLLSYVYRKTFEFFQRSLKTGIKITISFLFLFVMWVFALFVFLNASTDKTKLIAFISQLVTLTSMFVAFIHNNRKITPER